MPKNQEYYIKYKTQEIDITQYKIEITYFIYTGNVLSNIDVKKTKTINCPAYKLRETEDRLHNRIAKTYNLLNQELRKIGCVNKTAANAIIEAKMR